jgi:hypothetical protein
LNTIKRTISHAAFHVGRYLPRNDLAMTQLEAARQGEITPEMRIVASREALDPELVRA